MNRDWHHPAIWTMWLALPATALNYWRAWDRLPLHLAVHFDADWRPNGYTTREDALLLGLGIMAFLLVVFTVAAYAVSAQKPGSLWPVLLTFYVALTILWFANNYIVEFNLNRPPARSELVGPTSPAVSDSIARDATSVET
jgi:hypothetical protein